MIAHSPPAGSLKPSQIDVDFTDRIKDAGRLLDIKLLDHFIISSAEAQYFSFADEGLI